MAGLFLFKRTAPTSASKNFRWKISAQNQQPKVAHLSPQGIESFVDPLGKLANKRQGTLVDKSRRRMGGEKPLDVCKSCAALG